MFSPAIHKLRKRHSQLKQEIEREQGALSPDWTRVHHLKKWRLALKDALQRMAFSAPLALPYGPVPVLIPISSPSTTQARRPARRSA